MSLIKKRFQKRKRNHQLKLQSFLYQLKLKPSTQILFVMDVKPLLLLDLVSSVLSALISIFVSLVKRKAFILITPSSRLEDQMLLLLLLSVLMLIKKLKNTSTIFQLNPDIRFWILIWQGLLVAALVIPRPK